MSGDLDGGGVWVPGKATLCLNERADAAAKRGILLPQPETRPSFRSVKERLKAVQETLNKAHYSKVVPPECLHRRLGGLPCLKGTSRIGA